MTPSAIERAIMKMLQARQPRTACPSEVARALAERGWRQHMQPVRDAAARLAKRGRIDVLQRGKKVDVKTARGAIRLRLANHRTGRKYDDHGRVAPRDTDPEKARAAAVFRRVWRKIEADERYAAARSAWPRSSAR